jgi:hypothetical protein
MQGIRPYLPIAVIALVCVVADFAVTHTQALGMLDESYLWYGVWRTSLGEVPIRDFQAYDPLRYYWGAVWVWLLGDGIVAMRASGAILKFFMLLAGLSVLQRYIRAKWLLALAAVVMTVWASHFENAAGYFISVLAIWVGTRLMEQPSLRRHLWAGVFVGVAALVGRNHGVYGLTIFSVLMAIAWWQGGGDAWRRIRAFASGVVAGYSPMLLMWLLVPGFFNAFYDNLRSLLTSIASAGGSANLSKPIPWPWRVDVASMDALGATRDLVFGGLLVLLALVPLLVLIYLWTGSKPQSGRQSSSPHGALYATAVTGLVYVHYCYSRADISHFADAAQPFFMLLFMVPVLAFVGWPRRAVWLTCGATILTAVWLLWSVHPVVARMAHPQAFKQVEIRGDSLWMSARYAAEIASVRRVVRGLVRDGEGILFAPHRPGMYLLTDRPAPIKTIYFLTRKDESDREMIAALDEKKVHTVLLTRSGIDGRADLTFAALHPELYGYLQAEYRPGQLWYWGLPPYYELFRRDVAVSTGK